MHTKSRDITHAPAPSLVRTTNFRRRTLWPRFTEPLARVPNRFEGERHPDAHFGHEMARFGRISFKFVHWPREAEAGASG